MKNISTKEYNFTQTVRGSFLGERNMSLTGVFVEQWYPRKPPVSMLVMNPYSVTKEHTLMFWDGRGCSIFYVDLYNNFITNEAPICEMYLKDGYVDRKPGKGCQVFYKTNCKTAHLLYAKQCRLPSTTPPPIYDDNASTIAYVAYMPYYENEIIA